MASLDPDDHDVVAGKALDLHGDSERLDAEIERMPERHAEVDKLLDWPPVQPAQHAANVFVGAADELLRLVIALVLVTAVLIALTMLSSWFWAAVAAWVAYVIVAVILLGRRRRTDPSRAIDRMRSR